MVNIVAFSTHPDDVELVIGGVIAKFAKKFKVVIVDLTKGEGSSNGNEYDRVVFYTYQFVLNKILELKLFVDIVDSFEHKGRIGLAPLNGTI